MSRFSSEEKILQLGGLQGVDDQDFEEQDTGWGKKIKNDFGLFGLCADKKYKKREKRGKKIRIKTFKDKSTTIFKQRKKKKTFFEAKQYEAFRHVGSEEKQFVRRLLDRCCEDIFVLQWKRSLVFTAKEKKRAKLDFFVFLESKGCRQFLTLGNAIYTFFVSFS